MQDRRNFITSLFAGTAIAGFPAVSEVKSMEFTENSAIVLKVPGLVSAENVSRLKQSWHKEFPEVKCIVLSNGMDIEVIKNLR